ncbi:MAG: response regulator transcription factor [Chloroflexi bacterium]|nr:MAG: response regulator transcription factor [Chloroflexota bacterium]TMD92134.1 MAG: response regulator transcription factor [Chloroflexota bacterium]
MDNADAGARFQAPTSSTEMLIAIVEDDAALAGMFSDILGYAGNWRLHIFSDGQEARTTLPELRADLILLDVGLPNLDGASLYKILRGHSNTKNTPIIVITGSHDWELHRMGLQTGLLLRKPFEMEELLRMIRALLPFQEV